MGDRDLLKADLGSNGGDSGLMRRVAIAMDKGNGHRANTGVISGLQAPSRAVFIQGGDLCAVGVNPFSDFDHLLVQHFRQDNMPGKQVGTVLIADSQAIPKPLGGDKRGPVALAFQQCVGRDRGAHLHQRNRIGWNGRVAIDPEQIANALDRGVLIAFGIGRQQFMRHQGAVGTTRHQIGERPAAINPNLPPPSLV